jgi:hypothetical protein
MSDLKSNSSRIEITTTPHSGDLGLEHPVNDFDNTSLQEAVDSGLITIPGTVDFQPTTGETDVIPEVAPKPTKPTSDNPFARFFASTRNKVISGVAGAGLLVGGVTTVAVNANSAPDAAPTAPIAGEPFTPAPVPEVTEIPVDNPEITPREVPAELAPYRDMTPEAFSALSKEEQAPYIKFLFQDIDTFVQQWNAQRQIPADEAYVPASATNSPQEAYANYVWMQRFMMTLSESDALKAASFLLFNGTSSTVYNEWLGDINAGTNRPVQGMAEGDVFSIGTVSSVDEIKTVNGITIYDNVTIPLSTGGNSVGSLYLGDYEGFTYWSQINR